MKRYIFGILAVCTVLASCGKKEPQGKLVYTLSYELPAGQEQFAEHLPKEAIVYFKGDSVAVIEGNGDESTTVVTYAPSNFMQALLKSSRKKYAINYSKQDQDEERSHMPLYEATKGTQTKKLAGIDAQQYTLADKMTTESHEAWFATTVKVPKNYLSLMFDPALGTPLVFSSNQNGMVTHTTIKSINLDNEVPAGVFTAPADYIRLTPKAFQEMPVEE